MAPIRYSAKEDLHGTWSVFDTVTEHEAQMLGVLLIGLSGQLAFDMAYLAELGGAQEKPGAVRLNLPRQKRLSHTLQGSTLHVML